MWVFPKIIVPQNGWFIMDNPIKMDDLGGKNPIFGNTLCWIFRRLLPKQSRKPMKYSIPFLVAFSKGLLLILISRCETTSHVYAPRTGCVLMSGLNGPNVNITKLSPFSALGCWRSSNKLFFFGQSQASLLLPPKLAPETRKANPRTQNHVNGSLYSWVPWQTGFCQIPLYASLR